MAGGAILYEIDAREVGLAGAGWAARPDDAATLFRNPAGLSELDGGDLLLNAQLLYGDIGFTPDEKTTVEGGDGGNPIGAFPGGSFYYARRHSSGLGYGVGVLSYFGLAQEFDSGWVGRYYIQKSTLLGLTAMPAVSYALNDRFSVGAGLNVMYGIFDTTVEVRNAPADADGELIIDSSDTGIGANVGVMLETDEHTRVGVTYLSPVTLDFKDTPEFNGLGSAVEAALTRAGVIGAELDLGMEVPQTLMTSVHSEVSESWSIMFNFGWQDWERFGKVEVSLADTLGSVTADRRYRDTYHGAVGAEAKVSPGLLLTTGFAYDTSAVSDDNRTLDFATGETYRFAGGGRLQLRPTMQLGLGYTFIWSGDLPVDQFRGPLAGRVSGEFAGTALHFFAASLEWKL
jgi:long-chain fatty acid transport protein